MSAGATGGRIRPTLASLQDSIAYAMKWNRAFQNDENYGTETSGDDIAAIVSTEVRLPGAASNAWHGVRKDTLGTQLVAPARLERFALAGRTDKHAWLWIVFDESPGTRDGYLIVYSERTKTFGLATKSGPKAQLGSYLGSYGDTFREALAAM